MTLCAAWMNENGEISLASDSRFSYGASSHTDLGVKVIALPVRVVGATDGQTEHTSELYHYRWGLCFTGDVDAATAVVIFLSDFMSVLQYNSHTCDFSIEDLCDIIQRYHQSLSTQLSTDLQARHSFDMVIAGYCPQQNKIRAFSFTNGTSSTGDVYLNKQEVLLTNNHVFIGCAVAEAEAAFMLRSNLPMDDRILNTVQNVIDDPSHPGVGGYLQYGTFVNNNFIVYGVKKTINGQPCLVYRGLVMQSPQEDIVSGDFVPNIKFKMPAWS